MQQSQWAGKMEIAQGTGSTRLWIWTRSKEFKLSLNFQGGEFGRAVGESQDQEGQGQLARVEEGP